MLRIFEKRLSVDVKAKYLFLDIRLLVVKTELGSLADIAYEARRRDVDWLGGHSANHEAPEFSLRGSWMLCIPSLLQETIQNAHNYQCIAKIMSTVPLYVPLTRTGHAVPFSWVYPSRV